MKLEFRGHNELYVVEQSLMTLFPKELPVYEPIDPEHDDSWAIITLEEEPQGDVTRCHVTTQLCYEGRQLPFTLSCDLTGTDYEQEGQRRWAVAASFFQAAQKLTGIQPPWGMLTGVRPDKPVTQLLEQGNSPDQVREWMLEHYFVTEERTDLAMETGAMAYNAAKRLKPTDVPVYVGIPFCPTRCVYCSFVSQSVEKSFKLVPPYVDALIEELKAGGKMLRENGLTVPAFYMGGGTPTTLTAEQLDRVLTAFEQSFDTSHCTEITVEAGRPDTITEEKLRVMKDHGVTRISVNPQTMEDNVLRAIGRRHTAKDIVDTMELVEKIGFPHVNMDLIAGLPEDTPEGFQRSLDRCLQFGVHDITVHTLALKKGSRILMEGLSIPGSEAVGEMLSYAAPTLRQAGFAPYYLYRQKYMSGSFENIGWCRPGGECWYNVYIMSELSSILSFGAGGSTKMVVPGTNQIERAFNLKYPKEYTERPEKWAANQKQFAAFYQRLGL